MSKISLLSVLLAVCFCEAILYAQVSGTSSRNDLTIADGPKTRAVIVVSPSADANSWERRAAADLARGIEMMTGARPAMADTPEAASSALRSTFPVFVIGQAALAADPGLQKSLDRVAKKNPVLRADAIVLRRSDNRIYLAGTNDESHYYAVAELLKRWGCRWFLPTAFGECIPEYTSLKVGTLDYAYAPPFEVRKYWLSWLGDNTGRSEFMRRNMMNELGVPAGHSLNAFTKDIIPAGKTMFNVPIAEEATAEHVAQETLADFGAGKNIMLGMEDGTYLSDSPRDKELQAGLQDKYFLIPSMSDNFMVFYNNVARRLLAQAPDSKAKIGFLIYSNLTIPPQRKIVAEKPLVGYLAPIDFDPIHGMDDPKSPPRQEYRELMYNWAKVMQGRMIIYDYDQGMLVWRDIPNPAIASIRQDIKHYRNAGILGVDTESRGAMATTFLNLYIRGQLYWNPDADVDALLADFYTRFYGPAAEPMAKYWNAINKAWADSVITEHEFFVAPGIYSPELVRQLGIYLAEAEAKIAPLADRKIVLTRNQQLYVDRLQFTRLSYAVLKGYMGMVNAAATDVDYQQAVADGQRGLAARDALTKMNPTFTTTRLEGGYAWWPGEVQQYKELLPFTDGSRGKLVVKLPLEWAFRRDPHDTGIVSGWAEKPVDLGYWNSVKNRGSIASHMANPGAWEIVRTDLYPQAQGILNPDYTNYSGFAWYRTACTLTAGQAADKLHLRFPGLFNECWLYVNGELAAYRPQGTIWWLNDYRFEWDIDLAGKLQAGNNTLALRINNPHHMGGIFRRPFIYAAVAN